MILTKPKGKITGTDYYSTVTLTLKWLTKEKGNVIILTVIRDSFGIFLQKSEDTLHNII